MSLTVKQAQHAKPGRHSDGRGLYLLVKGQLDANGQPKLGADGLPVPGSKSWVLRVQRNGKRRDYGLGSFTLESVGDHIPLHKRRALTLNEARDKAKLGRDLAKAGIKPASVWDDEDAVEIPTFEQAARRYHEEVSRSWKNGKHGKQWLATLDAYAFPIIGSSTVDHIDAPAIQKVLLPIWLAKPETSRRVKQRIGVVLDYSHAQGWRDAEAPMRAVNQLMGGIKQPKGKHFEAMPYKDAPAFMAKLGHGEFSVGRAALQFLILSIARSNEVRFAKWHEIDLDAAEWRLPADKMKMGEPHIVPLVPAAVAILKQLRELLAPKPGDPLFPGNKGKPMSDATLAKVLRVNGGTGTVHGLRSTFRDWAADHGFNNDWAEAALAHSVEGQEGKTVAAYKRTTYFEHRRDKLMPAWASFVLGDNSKVISLAAARA
jgi:integrase